MRFSRARRLEGDTERSALIFCRALEQKLTFVSAGAKRSEIGAVAKEECKGPISKIQQLFLLLLLLLFLLPRKREDTEREVLRGNRCDDAFEAPLLVVVQSGWIPRRPTTLLL